MLHCENGPEEAREHSGCFLLSQAQNPNVFWGEVFVYFCTRDVLLDDCVQALKPEEDLRSLPVC